MLLNTGYEPRASSERGERETEQRLRLVGLAYGEGMRSMGREWPRGMPPQSRWNDEVLPGVSCPTLLMCGREDKWSPLARHEQMAARIPGALLAVIEDAGHMTTMERPGSVSATMRDFLCAAAPSIGDTQ